mmetsp:Transcript_40801/g.53763  ORF Transcript_40801/g.53763 Transcript_40801/m.53763 type:complete len:188 (+) Transcript_40801:102-665(+)
MTNKFKLSLLVALSCLILDFCRVKCISKSSQILSNANAKRGNNLPLISAFPRAPGYQESHFLEIRGGAKGKVTEVKTQEEVEKILEEAEDNLVVIDFTAVWCGPCQMIAPAYEQFSESAEFKDIIFLKCDVDDNKETASKYNVYQMPTFVFLRKGEVVRTFSGASPVKLKQTLESLQEESMAMSDNK